MLKPDKILIVDDDPEDQEFLLAAINELYPGSKSIVKNDGAEALDYIEKNPPPPSLIFLDLNMPFVNGFEFLSTYKKRPESKDTRVIIYTTSTHPRDKAITKDLGASDYMTKVGDPAELKKNIRHLVEQIF